MRVGSIGAAAATRESKRVETSARNVANVNTDGYRPEREDGSLGAPGLTVPDDGGAARVLSGVDLGAETVTQISGQRAFEAALALIRTDDEMSRAVIDLKR